MTKPTGYWCPMCGDLPETSNPFPWIPGEAWHHGACDFRAIPVYTPLAVPEQTTWGESGGEDAITLHINLVTPWWMVGDNHRAVVDRYLDLYWMSQHGKSQVYGDVVNAMNFLERSKK